MNLPYNPTILPLGIHPRKIRVYILTKIYVEIPIILIHKTKTGNNPNVYQVMNALKNVYSYNGTLFS